MKWRLITFSPADLVGPSRKVKKDISVFDEVQTLLRWLEDTYLYMPVFLIVYTGSREGEVLALRWSNVDWDNSIIHIRRSLYQRTSGQPLFKETKNKNTRAVDVSPAVIKELKKYRTQQKKERIAFGPG